MVTKEKRGTIALTLRKGMGSRRIKDKSLKGRWLSGW